MIPNALRRCLSDRTLLAMEEQMETLQNQEAESQAALRGATAAERKARLQSVCRCAGGCVSR